MSEFKDEDPEDRGNEFEDSSDLSILFPASDMLPGPSSEYPD